MSNSETKRTTENSLQTTMNDLDGIVKMGDPFWKTPIDFKITTFDMPIYADQLAYWAEDFGDRYGNKLQIKKIPS